jgi:methylglutaconyl-CoA hydratase
MSTNLVEVSVQAGVFRITLKRADKRNALSRDLLKQLGDAVASAAADKETRVVLLASTGSVFCAGMDLAEMQETATQPDAKAVWQRDTEVYHDLLTSLFRLTVPTLAVVQGPVLAGGVGLVAACDLVVAADTASVALPEPKRGITAAVVLPLLVHRVGATPASWLLLSGEQWTAEAARRAGFFHELTPAASLESRAKALTASILTGAPSALAVTKQHLQACTTSDLERQLIDGMRHSAEARETTDAREGLAAFLEKRKPKWAP